MNKQILVTLNKLVFIFSMVALFSCGKLADDMEPEPDQVDLIAEIAGKKAEMVSTGYMYWAEHNGVRQLDIAFIGGASLTTINALSIEIPDYKAGKTSYSVEKGEVNITYQGNVEIWEDDSAEWTSTKGTVEITKLNEQFAEGKVTATLKTPGAGNKTIEVKNGVFKAPKQ